MKKLAEKEAAGQSGLVPNSTTGGPPIQTNSSTLKSRQGGSFWLPTLGPLGKVRNVWVLVYPHSTWQLAVEELDVPHGFAPGSTTALTDKHCPGCGESTRGHQGPAHRSPMLTG
jgi:hypothetical protein